MQISFKFSLYLFILRQVARIEELENLVHELMLEQQRTRADHQRELQGMTSRLHVLEQSRAGHFNLNETEAWSVFVTHGLNEYDVGQPIRSVHNAPEVAQARVYIMCNCEPQSRAPEALVHFVRILCPLSLEEQKIPPLYFTKQNSKNTPSVFLYFMWGECVQPSLNTGFRGLNISGLQSQSPVTISVVLVLLQL